MIRKDPPKKPPLGDVPSRLVNSHQMQVWLKRLLALPESEIVDVSDIDPELLTLLSEQLMKRRNITVPTTLYRKWMRALTPILCCPQFDDLAGDTRLMFSLPEVREFWQQWSLPREDAEPGTRPRTNSFGRRGPNALTRGTKATLMTMASPGTTSHLKAAHAILSSNAAAREVYADLMWELHGRGGDPQFSLPSYQTVSRHWQPLFAAARKPALRANIAMIKRLREQHEQEVGEGKSPIGRGLLTDGTPIVGWAPQWAPARSLPDAERERIEARLRKHAPDATFRAYSQKSDGSKVNIEQDGNLSGSVRGNRSKYWRGYLLCAIVDQATGLALVWTLIPNKDYEAAALLTMLAELHELWPDIDAEWIAGDGLYDDDDLSRLCMQNYGIHPVFRHNTRNSAALGPLADGKVYDKLDKQGRVICRRHKKPMEYRSYTMAGRDGLRPGQPNHDKFIDMRVECTCDERASRGPQYGPCGTATVAVQADWSRLVKFPHHNGHPDRYAFRKAAEMRLNGIEAAWSALKGAHGLGAAGANRMRQRELPAYEGAISIAFMQRTALTLWDQLDRRGQAPPALPARPINATLATGGRSVSMIADPDTGALTGTVSVDPAARRRPKAPSHAMLGKRGMGRRPKQRAQA